MNGIQAGRLRLVASLFTTLLVTATMLAGCGGGDAGSGPDLQPGSPGTVGASGGTVRGPAGSQVVIPAGALSQNVAIAIAQGSAGAPALPAGAIVAGPLFAFTPHGTTFAAPATITVPFDPALVTAGSIPTLYKTTAGQAGWEIVAGATASGSAMTAAVSSFSFLTVIAAPAVVATDRPW